MFSMIFKGIITQINNVIGALGVVSQECLDVVVICYTRRALHFVASMHCFAKLPP